MYSFGLVSCYIKVLVNLLTHFVSSVQQEERSIEQLTYTTHNLISIIALISIGLTAMSLPLRSSITLSICL